MIATVRGKVDAYARQNGGGHWVDRAIAVIEAGADLGPDYRGEWRALSQLVARARRALAECERWTDLGVVQVRPPARTADRDAKVYGNLIRLTARTLRDRDSGR